MKLSSPPGILLVVLFLPGCAIPFHIAAPGVKPVTRPMNIEDPDKYRVDSAIYPAFRIKARFEPPRWKAGAGESKYPMVSIEPTDTWRVTHQVGDVFLIYSDTYNDRQCRMLAAIEPNGMAGGFIGRWGSTCHSDHLYHIPITLDGTVRNGWKLLYNPKRFGFARDRYINMQIDPATPSDWGPQPLFAENRKPNRKPGSENIFR